jgi:hypothetical protein
LALMSIRPELRRLLRQMDVIGIRWDLSEIRHELGHAAASDNDPLVFRAGREVFVGYT